ncbi:MAG: CbiX/SirB N-terminal domain-containing protein [Chromatiales bacterium]|nr:CbiX/SirB N-terminal domain-containing protein [Chromatiales bacterium]
MRALVLVAHGSRRGASNDEVRELAARLAAQAGARFELVRAAFLELAEPSIPDGITQCVRDGAGEVVVLPYFLSAGRHVATDIPAAVDEARAANPDADIRLAPYLGQSAVLATALLELAG